MKSLIQAGIYMSRGETASSLRLLSWENQFFMPQCSVPGNVLYNISGP